MWLRLFPAVLVTALLALSACSKPHAGDRNPHEPLPDVAAAGSAEPHLAAGPDGGVIMSWLEKDGGGVALRYSVLDGDTWSPVATVASGDDWFVNWADFPSVVAIDEALWAAHWLVKAADGVYEYDVAVSLSTDGGATWVIGDDPLLSAAKITGVAARSSTLLVASSLLSHNDSAEARAFREQLGLPTDRPIVMSGHQAQIWHPGILSKYLAAIGLAIPQMGKATYGIQLAATVQWYRTQATAGAK